jgi:hypothetical protein
VPKWCSSPEGVIPARSATAVMPVPRQPVVAHSSMAASMRASRRIAPRRLTRVAMASYFGFSFGGATAPPSAS